MPVRDVEDLKTRMHALMGKWHKGTRAGNDGDPGNTLEDLLGVSENNLKLPDFGDIELKTQKYEGGGLITLFHKEPTPIGGKAVTPSVIRSLGWRHKEAGSKYPATELRFTSTTYGSYYTVRGLSLRCDDEQICILFDPAQVKLTGKDKTYEYSGFATYKDWLDGIGARQQEHYSKIFPIPFRLSEVQQWFKDKLNHTLLVLRETKLENGQLYYRYKEAYLMKDIKPEAIVELINSGGLCIEFDTRSGHNHGLKFRIKRKSLHKLFNEFALMI